MLTRFYRKFRFYQSPIPHYSNYHQLPITQINHYQLPQPITNYQSPINPLPIPNSPSPICKQVFLALTQLGEGTEDTRRRCFKQDLVNKRYSEELVDSVIQQLVDEKLIVTSEMVAKKDESKRVIVVDIAHEALIRYWTL